MNTTRRPQPRRSRRNQQAHTRVRPAIPQANHHHVIIDATNAGYWLAHMRESASRARVQDGPQAGEGFDALADDLEACIDSGWRGADGRPVQQWQYHMWVSPHPQGLFETIIELWPEYLAA